jgi:hypothetical protein
MTFSSYPGSILSIDDFYLMKSNIVAMETTITNMNADLWKYVVPQSNLYWVRNLVANRLSKSGIEWATYFSQYNSGTYNNEWMIVDYNLFTPGAPLRDNLLIVLDQMPGIIIWTDQTDFLRKNAYWPSYNIP